MIFGNGIDITNVDRLKKAIESSDSFKYKVFTKKEIDYCENLKASYQSYSGRFAAKEAFLKALGIGLAEGICFTDIEILNDDTGKPYINLYNQAEIIFKNKRLLNIFLSISHENEYAVACVII